MIIFINSFIRKFFNGVAKNNSLQTLNLLPEFIDTNIYVYKNLWETHCEIDPDYFYDEIMHGKNNEGLTPIECTSNIDIQKILDEITASIRAVIVAGVRISIDDCLTNSLFLKTAKNLHYTKLIYSGILVMYHTKNQKKKNNNMETVINDTRHNVIATLCDHFKIDLENALKTCKTFSIENKNTNLLNQQLPSLSVVLYNEGFGAKPYASTTTCSHSATSLSVTTPTFAKLAINTSHHHMATLTTAMKPYKTKTSPTTPTL